MAVGNASGAIVAARDQRADGTILYGASITTTHGGFVTVRNASGGLIGISEYRNHGNGNRIFDSADRPHRVYGSPVHDAARVELKPVNTPSSPPSASPTSPGTPSPEVTSLVTTPKPSSPTTPGQPGFGFTLAVLTIFAALATRVRVD